MSPANFHRDRRKLDGFRPGHIFMLQPGATWLNQDKPRPYVLVTPCDLARRGTLVYGSTRQTERAAAASSIEVAPRALGVNANGLLARTFFYPGVLFPTRYDALPPHIGNLGTAMEALRHALAYALGIGSGTCLSPDAPARSRRGRIVLLDPVFESAFDTRFAVVLTQHQYSSEQRYQAIVPILRGDGAVVASNIVRVQRQPWLSIFPKPTASALLVAPVIQSVWHPEHIAAETQFVVDEGSLHALEERLCAMLAIEPRSD
ncbi:MAG TPA: hypothetical protein VFJ82_26215 [Longimicrobium sp.]|nr:hypothetical protein [Longimicrobium sp.]